MKNGYNSRISPTLAHPMSAFPKDPKPYSNGEILAIVRSIIGQVAIIYTTTERTVVPCGYLVVRSLEGQLLLGEKINNPDPAEKLPSWTTNALEKTNRLSKNPDHVSAWQTRDFDNKSYGGGIKALAHLLGFSGMPEHADEALLVGTGLCMGWLTLEQAVTIFGISGNDRGKQVVNWLVENPI